MAIEIVKIQNPLWLGAIAPQIAAYHERTKQKGITYESLWTYFTQIVQFGGENAEFSVAINDGEPVAFAVWAVGQLPLIGTVYGDHIYHWCKDKKIGHDAVIELTRKFIEFGRKWNAPLYRANLISDSRMEIFKKVLNEVNMELLDSNQRTVIAREVT